MRRSPSGVCGVSRTSPQEDADCVSGAALKAPRRTTVRIIPAYTTLLFTIAPGRGCVGGIRLYANRTVEHDRKRKRAW
jgi:hypothetical protein